MTTAEKLRVAQAASDLLEKSGWITCNFAQDENGRGVFIGSDKACKFCLVGGLARAAINLKLMRGHGAIEAVHDVRLDLLKLLRKEGFEGEGVSNWNDAQDNVDDVLVLLEKYIEQLEKEAA